MKRISLTIAVILMVLQACTNVTQEKTNITVSEDAVTNHVSQKDSTNDFVFDADMPMQPEFPGGVKELVKYLWENIEYPAEAHKKGIQGRVIVQFVVKTDGSITDAKVLKSVEESLDAEALRLVNNMSYWKPAMAYGKPIEDTFVMPVNFRLQDDDAVKVDTAATDSTRYSVQVSKKPLRMTTGDSF